MNRREFFGGAVAASAAFQATQAETNKAELKSSQYAIVELLGYKKLCGRLSQGIAGLLQLDVPVEGGTVTQFINPASIYRVTIVDAATVKAYAKHVDPLPTIELEVPAMQRSLGYRDDDEYGDSRDEF